MKLKRKSLEKDGGGYITLLPEEAEDMWHAYNLISKGDRVRSSTFRRISSESATGSSTSERIKTTLTIAVTDIHFDTQSGILNVNGRVVSENKFVKVR